MIALLGLGATSGGVALGMIPQPFTASAPAPSSAITATTISGAHTNVISSSTESRA